MVQVGFICLQHLLVQVDSLLLQPEVLLPKVRRQRNRQQEVASANFAREIRTRLKAGYVRLVRSIAFPTVVLPHVTAALVLGQMEQGRVLNVL